MLTFGVVVVTIIQGIVMFSPTCARVNGAKLMLTCGIVGVTTTQGTVMFSPTGTRVNDANWCLPVVL